MSNTKRSPGALQWLVVVAAILLSGQVRAGRIADDGDWTGTVGNATTGGGTANATIVGGSGLNVSATASTNNSFGIGGPAAVPLSASLGTAEAGILPTWYSPDMSPVAGRFGFHVLGSLNTTFTGSTMDPACSHAVGSPVGSTITCHGTSTLTITFEHPVTNPVLHLSRAGGGVNVIAGPSSFSVSASFELLTPNAGMSLLNSNGRLAVSGNTIAWVPPPPGVSIIGLCSDLTRGTGCGSIRINGTFTTLTFRTTMSVQRVSGTTVMTGFSGDVAHLMVSVEEDYGDAPASYDPGTNDASHILTDLRLGPAATADNTTLINTGATPSPFIGAAMPTPTASGDANDDGASIPANVSNVAGASTTIPVQLSGASKAGTVCGWLDFNRNGAFTSAEGVCQAFAANATNAVLTLTTPAGAGTGATVVRIRASYDAMSTSTFTGLLDSGEVEDYVASLGVVQPDFGTCDARMFMDQIPSNTSTLFNVDYGTAPFTLFPMGSSTSTTGRNAVGYNALDNYIYGIRWPTGSGLVDLIRVGSNGAGQNLGPIAGLPTGTTWNNGVISPTGDYYLKSGLSTTTLYRVNLATLPYTATPITLSQPVQAFDLAWHNGRLYGVDITSSPAQLVSIDPVSGAVTTLGPTFPLNNALAMWGFNNMLLGSSGGAIYALDPVTGASTLMSIISPTSNNGDGANCPTANISFNGDLSVTKTNTPASGPNDLPTDTYTPGETRTYTIVVSNPNTSFGAQNITVSDPVPAGIDVSTVSWTCANTSGGSRCAAASGTGALNDTALDLPSGSVATYQVTMTVPTTFTGDLSNTVTITPPSYFNDTNAANNTATDIDFATARLTLTKISQGGTRAFTFTGNNGWASQTLTTLVPGVGVTGTTQTLSTLGTATTITETMPTGFVLSGVTCTGMGAGGAVTTGANSFTLNAAAVVAGSNIACTVTNSVQSQPVFPTCPAGMYLSQSPNTNTNTTLYDIVTTTNPFTYPAIGQGANVYNAIGFNPVDNFIYGINGGGGSGNRLIRVGADGSSVDLGPVAGGMVTDNWIMGTFSDTGVMYVLAGGGSTNLRVINVQTNTSTLVTLSASVQASDMAWIGGLIYTVQGNGQLRSINPATGTVTNIGSPTAAVDYGAMFGSPTGLFGSANGGGFYRFDLATGARTLISSSPGSNVNDGASCPTAPITFSADLSVTKTNTPAQGPNDLPDDPYVPGEVRTYSIVVTNQGPFGMQNASVIDAIPAGIDAATVSWTCASISGGAVCGAASGTGALNDTGLDLPPNAVATYLVTLTVPTGFTGALSNTVTVTPPNNINDTDTSNNTATDVDTQATANLSITKASTTSPVVAGGTISYSIVVTNSGPSAADNAVVSDDWTTVPGLDCSATAVPPGTATCAASGTAGTQCPAPASVTPAGLQAGLAIPALPNGGIVTFTLQCAVTATGQ